MSSNFFGKLTEGMRLTHGTSPRMQHPCAQVRSQKGRNVTHLLELKLVVVENSSDGMETH